MSLEVTYFSCDVLSNCALHDEHAASIDSARLVLSVAPVPGIIALRGDGARVSHSYPYNGIPRTNFFAGTCASAFIKALVTSYPASIPAPPIGATAPVTVETVE